MKSTKVIIAAVVVVIIIAGAAAFVLLNDDSDDPVEKVHLDTQLAVYGNADNDSYIDSDDRAIIQDIIDGKKSLADYPLADANRDGKVDADDLTVVDRIIAGERTDVYAIDQIDRVVKVSYPMDNVIAVSSDICTFMACSGFSDTVVGMISSSIYPNIYQGMVDNGAENLEKSRTLSATSWAAIKDIDAKLYKSGEGVGAVICDREKGFSDVEQELKDADIPAIVIRATDPSKTLPGTLLIGFLLGPEHYKGCQDYVLACEKATNDLNEKVASLSEDQKVKFLAMCSIRCTSGTESQYTQLGIHAGGIAKTKIQGDTSPLLQTVDAITEYDDLIDKIINFKTLGCANGELSDTWEAAKINYVTNSAHFEDMAFINCSMPTTCRVLYAASFFYPDLIDRDYVDSFFQDIVDNYMTFLDRTQDDGDFDVRTDMMTMLTYEDYQKLKSA